MKQYGIEIHIPKYLQHRMRDEVLEKWEKKRGAIIERDDIHKEDKVRAEYHAYRNKDKKLYLPSEHIRGSLIGGGGFVKAKVGNTRRSMKNIVAGMFEIEPEEIILPQKYEIDKRSAVNKNVKARVITIRPRWNDFKVKFILNVDNDTLTDETVKLIIENAGQYVGIGSFRPTNQGSFGRFKITQFKPLHSA